MKTFDWLDELSQWRQISESVQQYCFRLGYSECKYVRHEANNLAPRSIAMSSNLGIVMVDLFFFEMICNLDITNATLSPWTRYVTHPRAEKEASQNK